MGEVERKVDMLISGMKTPKKKTRSRVVTIATTLIIASVLIATASLINVYYVQTGTVDVTSLITVNGHDAEWEEGITIGGELDPVFYEGTTYISDPYTIAYANPDPLNPPPTITVYFHITVTENGESINNGDGLLVEVWDGDPSNSITQILDFAPGDDRTFTIHVTAMDRINAASTYGYTIKIDWNPPD